MPLSEDQKRVIEENRQKALAKRKNVDNASPGNNNKRRTIQNTNQNPPSGSGAAWALSKLNRKPSPIPLTSLSKAKSSVVPSEKTQPIIKYNKNDHRNIKGANTNQFYGKGKTIKCKLTLLDRRSFKVEMPYHAGAISVFKEVQSSTYNAADRIWSFDLKDHSELARRLRPFQPEIQLDPLPRWVLETFSSNKKELEKRAENLNVSINQDPNEPTVEPTLWENLMPFQKEGVRYAIGRRGRILLADDMGLGKTIQALGIASAYKAKWPLFIVCPSSMRFAWKAAVVKWLPSVPEEDVVVITSGSDEIDHGDQVLIISYNLVSRKERELINWDFGVAILDESHFLKDNKSIRFKSLESIVKDKVDHLILLSGTPALSRPIELFTQISLIEPKLFKFATDFGMRYCDGRKLELGPGKSWHDFSGHSNMNELKLLLEERFMIRRLKSDVLKQLPSKQREMIILDPSLVKSKSRVMQEKVELMSQNTNKNKEHAMLLEWFHLTCDAKVKAVCEYVKDLLESDRKFLLFAHHQTMMKNICDVLEKQKVKYIKIDGATSSLARKTQCDDFQTCDQIRVAVLSITAASTGITLTSAQLVVFAELFWNPGILTQAEDRAHRIGQTDSVTVQYLVAIGTADDKLWPMIQKKLDVLNKAGLSKDNFSNSDSRNVEQKISKKDYHSPKPSTLPSSSNELMEDDSFNDINWDSKDDLLENINWDEEFELKDE